MAPWLAGLAAVLCVMQPAYLPTVDGPQFLYASYILRHYRELSAWYQPALPFGSMGVHLVLMPLSLVLPWALAYRIALGVFVGVWCAGSAALARSIRPERAWLAVVTAALALQWSLYMGFLSFTFATGIGFWALAIAVRGPRRPWALPLLLLLVTSGHLFVGLLTSLVVLFVRQADCPRSERVRRLVLDSLPLLVCGVVITDVSSSGQADTWSQWLPVLQRVQAMGKTMAGGPWWRCTPPVLGALAGASLALWRGSRTERALGVVVLGGLLVAVLTPLHMTGWMYMSPRFLPLPTLVGLTLLPLERLAGPAATAARALLALWSLAALAWSASFHRTLGQQLQPLLAVLDAPVQRTGPRLPILARDPLFVGNDSMENPYPYHDPVFNLPLLPAMSQGGVFPYTFTQLRALHPFVLRPGHPPLPPVPTRESFWVGLLDPEVRSRGTLRQALLTDLASWGAPYEDVILFGGEEDQALLRGRGYETAWQSSDAWIGSFRGCPTQLTLQVPGGAPGRWAVSFGWLPLRAPAWEGEATREAGASAVQVSLPRAPCGPLWVSVTPVGDEPAPWHCQGANEGGQMVFPTRKQKASLVCSLVEGRAGATSPPGAQSP